MKQAYGKHFIKFLINLFFNKQSHLTDYALRKKKKTSQNCYSQT